MAQLSQLPNIAIIFRNRVLQAEEPALAVLEKKNPTVIPWLPTEVGALQGEGCCCKFPSDSSCTILGCAMYLNS